MYRMGKRLIARYRVRDAVGTTVLTPRGAFYDDEDIAVGAARGLAKVLAMLRDTHIGIAVDDLTRPEGQRVVFVTGRGWGEWDGTLRERYTFAPSEIPAGMENDAWNATA